MVVNAYLLGEYTAIANRAITNWDTTHASIKLIDWDNDVRSVWIGDYWEFDSLGQLNYAGNTFITSTWIGLLGVGIYGDEIAIGSPDGTMVFCGGDSGDATTSTAIMLPNNQGYRFTDGIEHVALQFSNRCIYTYNGFFFSNPPTLYTNSTQPNNASAAAGWINITNGLNGEVLKIPAYK